jgi:hypothetical protein
MSASCEECQHNGTLVATERDHAENPQQGEAKMARYELIALSNAKSGREAEFNNWYDKVRLPDMLKVPGVVSGERFVNAFPAAHKFVAVFDVETESLEALAADINARASSGAMVVSDALDTKSVLMNFCAPYLD